MSKRERVMAALNHKQPDKIPYHINFTIPARQKMVEYYRDDSFETKLGNCFTILGCEPKNAWIEKQNDIWADQFGVMWDRKVDKDIGVVCNQVVTKENLAMHRFPDPHDPSRYSKYREIIAANMDGFVIVNLGFSLFERAWTMHGMEPLLMAMITDKSFVHDLLDRIVEFNLAVIDHVCTYPIDAMMFGDDWGQQNGLIMGKKLWDEFIRPRIRIMYAKVRSHNKYVFNHSCGKVDELFPDLIDAGLHVFNPFQPEVMDVFRMKKQYGDSLCYYGGISTQQTLPYGSVSKVKEEVKKLLDVVGNNGGYFASPAHDIPGDARPENIAAMIEVLQNQ